MLNLKMQVKDFVQIGKSSFLHLTGGDVMGSYRLDTCKGVNAKVRRKGGLCEPVNLDDFKMATGDTLLIDQWKLSVHVNASSDGWRTLGFDAPRSVLILRGELSGGPIRPS